MKDKIILGNGIEYSSDCYKTGLNNNICLTGSTGSGKTRHFIIPRLLHTYNANVIINDPKRELFETYSKDFLSKKYNVQEINLIEPRKSKIIVDPFQYVASDNDVAALARAIVNLCPQSTNSHADRYWEDSASNLATFGLYYVLATCEAEPKLSDFIDFIDNLEINETNILMTTNVDSFMDNLKAERPDHPMIPFYNAFKCTPIRTAGSIFTTLKTTLANVFNDDMKSMLKTANNINIEEFAKNKNALFISSSGSNEYIDAFVNLIFDTLIRELFKIADKQKDGTLPIETFMVLDDFACGTKINSFPKYISLFRSKGFSATIVLQSESQLTDMYGEYAAHTIMNNCDTLVYLGGNDLQTAENYAKRLNVPVEDVLYMPLDKTYIFRRGQKPITAEKYPITTDKRYINLSKKSQKGEEIYENKR